MKAKNGEREGKAVKREKKDMEGWNEKMRNNNNIGAFEYYMPSE